MIIDISDHESRYERESLFTRKTEYQLAIENEYLPLNELDYYPFSLQSRYQYIALRGGRFSEDQDSGYYSQNRLIGIIADVKILSRIETRNIRYIRRINKCS